MLRWTGAAHRDGGEVEEQIGWLDDAASRRLFAVQHMPKMPHLGLLICSPIGAEFDANYRREVLVSRALAASHGVAVLRFHYRGTGNSPGEASKVDVRSMTHDATAVARHFAEEIGSAPAVLGTRSSAFAALNAAAEVNSPAVVLWQPPATGKEYLRELGRLRSMTKLVQQSGKGEHALSLRDELEANGAVEIAGYELHRRLFDNLMGATLDLTTLPTSTASLVVQFGGPTVAPTIMTQI